MQMIYDVWLPQALSIGVNWNTFWELNPKTLKIHASAFKVRQDETRFNLWLQGYYFKQAVVSAFNAEAPYPDKPLDLTAKQNVPETPVSETANKAIQFSAWADMYNERVIKQQEGQ